MSELLTKSDFYNLSDTAASNIRMRSQIFQIAKKHNYLREEGLSIDCYTNGCHYISFKLNENTFTWSSNKGELVLSKQDEFLDDTESIEACSLNKLLSFTLQSIYEKRNYSDEKTDPCEVLASAEEHLRKVLLGAEIDG